MKIERIVVSTDLSEASRHAFPVAASLARHFKSRLTVVHVTDFPQVGPEGLAPGSLIVGDRDVEQYLEGLERDLAELVDADAVFEGLGVERHLVRNATLDAYREFLVATRADLVVLATHGRTGVSRMLLGSFAERFLRYAPCPALVCRRTASSAPAEGFAPRRILAPTDFSPNSRPALEWASGLARSFGAQARLFHVIEYEPGLYGLSRDISGTWHEYEERVTQDFMARFREFVEQESEGFSADMSIRKGRPIDRILEEVGEFGADLVVVGTHGRTGWDRFLLGSTAEQVVRRAPCPVLVVRGPEDAYHAGEDPGGS